MDRITQVEGVEVLEVGDQVAMPQHFNCESDTGKVTVVLREDLAVADCESCDHWVYVRI